MSLLAVFLYCSETPAFDIFCLRVIIPVSAEKCNYAACPFSLFYCLFAQQLTQSVAGQGLNGELHGTDALIQRQAAVHLGDEGSDLFLLILRAVDDGTNFLALLLHDALGDGRAEGQLLFQLFGADVLAAGEDDKVISTKRWFTRLLLLMQLVLVRVLVLRRLVLK